MKVVLLQLSGSMEKARESLAQCFPQATIELLKRAELEDVSPARRIGLLRECKPDVFAVSTERLAFQRGQELMLLLGALGGAQRAVIVDSHGSVREETRTQTLAATPFRSAQESVRSATTLFESRASLKRLEGAVALRRSVFARQESKLKITYLRSTPAPGTQSGGASTHISGVVKALLEAGADVSMISNDEIAGLDERCMPLRVVWPEPVGATRALSDLYNNLRFTSAVVDEIARHPCDFIYQRYARFSWCGVEASIRSGRPLFLEYNGSEVWIGKNWDRTGMLELLARCERLNLDASDRIFVVSEVERSNLLKQGVAEEKIIVNPNGVDVDWFKPGVGGVSERRRMGITDREILFGFVGTFGPWHGVITLGRAIASMKSEKDTRFLFVGDGLLKSEVEEIIAGAGMSDRVTFLNAVPHDRVPALLDACDVLVSPHVPLADGSEFFGSPTKLFEYMAMGKGIVASRLGQIGEILCNDETALLVTPGDERELAEAMRRMAESVELRERLGKAARVLAQARFTWKHNAARVMEAYESLVS